MKLFVYLAKKIYYETKSNGTQICIENTNIMK